MSYIGYTFTYVINLLYMSTDLPANNEGQIVGILRPKIEYNHLLPISLKNSIS